MTRKLARVMRSKAYEKELSLLEREIELAEKDLASSTQKDDAKLNPLTEGRTDPEQERESELADNDSKYSDRTDAQQIKPTLMEKRIQSLLESEGELNLSQFPSLYKKKFGANWKDHAEKGHRSGLVGPREKGGLKLASFLRQLQVCEVLTGSKDSTREAKIRLRVQPDTKGEEAATQDTKHKISSSSGPKEDDHPSTSPIQKVLCELDVATFAVATSEDAMSIADQHEGAGFRETVIPGPTDEVAMVADKRAEDLKLHGAAVNEPKGGDSACNGSRPIDADEHLIGDWHDYEDYISQALLRYSKEGALGADDLLDELSNTTFSNTSACKALRVILQKELGDDTGISGLIDIDDGGTKGGLPSVICSLAKAVTLSADYPRQAKECAVEALQLAGEENNTSSYTIPSIWLAEAEKLSLYKPQTSSIRVPQRVDVASTWSEIESKDKTAPAVMNDSILPMIGLESLKWSLVEAYHTITLAREQGESAASSYNVLFEGNPGTGKTTICRYYGKFLQQLSILPETSLFKETSGAKLVNEGVNGLKEQLKEISEAGGGIIFIDEAYQLVEDREGKKVLDIILPLAESLETADYGKIVWVFAGYKKQMEKIFEHNPGLPSSFPHRFTFEDYTDEELLTIFKDLMEYKVLNPSPAEKPVRSIRRSQTSLNYRNTSGSMVDRFNRSWTYDPATGWTDDLRNNTVNPGRVGMEDSKLVSPDGEFWTEKNGRWTSDSGRSQTWFPGEAKPQGSRTKRNPPFYGDEDYLRIAIQRLGRRRGDKGFGNARAVRILFDRVKGRQATRIARERTQERRPDIYYFSKEDLLGPEIDAGALNNCEAWKQLQAMEGLEPVKTSVQQLFKVVLNNLDREKRGEPLFEVQLNRLFLGNPGTGKTTVAALYGKILARLGLLSKGEVLLKKASEFVGDVLGMSEKTTRSIIEQARGTCSS
jgi:DNA polymerase III delta prime subunit